MRCWFRKWLGAVKQHAIAWANVNVALCHHKASLGQNEFTKVDNNDFYLFMEQKACIYGIDY